MNPFTPGWGFAPRVLIGRDRILERYRHAFAPEAAADVHRRSHLAAPRSTGKTVLLDAIEDIAGEQGWHSISVDTGTKTSPLGERIIRELRKLDRQLQPPGRRITSVNASVIGIGGGVGWDNPADDDLRWGDLRTALEHMVTRTNGLLVTIDEVHEASRTEIHELGNAFQHLARDEQPIAIVMAGLPTDAELEPTFVRRSHKPELSLFVEADAIRYGFEQTARLEGWRFERNALARAVHHAAGVPYMMQLIGHASVEAARDAGRHEITTSDVTAAALTAARDFTTAVSGHLNVTRHQMRYLMAMAIDEDASSTGTIARRLNLTASHANTYRDALVKADDHHRTPTRLRHLHRPLAARRPARPAGLRHHHPQHAHQPATDQLRRHPATANARTLTCSHNSRRQYRIRQRWPCPPRVWASPFPWRHGL